jgi:hypothetical protein
VSATIAVGSVWWPRSSPSNMASAKSLLGISAPLHDALDWLCLLHLPTWYIIGTACACAWALVHFCTRDGLDNAQCLGRSYFALAVLSNGTVVGWGANDYGVLNIPTQLTQPQPAAVAALSAGSSHALALLAETGQVGCRGLFLCVLLHVRSRPGLIRCACIAP